MTRIVLSTFIVRWLEIPWINATQSTVIHQARTNRVSRKLMTMAKESVLHLLLHRIKSTNCFTCSTISLPALLQIPPLMSTWSPTLQVLLVWLIRMWHLIAQNDSWILDSWASKHIFANKNLFYFPKTLHNSSVTLPNYTSMPVFLWRLGLVLACWC